MCHHREARKDVEVRLVVRGAHEEEVPRALSVRRPEEHRTLAASVRDERSLSIPAFAFPATPRRMPSARKRPQTRQSDLFARRFSSRMTLCWRICSRAGEASRFR